MKSRVFAFFAAALIALSFCAVWWLRDAPAAASAAALSPTTEATAAAPTPRPPQPRVRMPVAAPLAAAPTNTEELSVIASTWTTDPRPEFAAFRDWTARYLAADAAGRAALLDEGRHLAVVRRVVLADLIRADPRAALAAAVPMVVRQELPADILALLEERIAGRGELALLAVTPEPGAAGRVTEPVFRSALIDGQEYRAHVYGRREAQATLASASLHGIALDGHLAVAESPVRLAEAGERVPAAPLAAAALPPAAHNEGAPPVAVAVAYNGAFHNFCCVSHVPLVESPLIAAENLHLEADNQPGSSTVSGRPSQSWTHGVKQVLIIRVDFSDKPGVPLIPYANTPITEDLAVNLFTQTGGIADFYEQSSFDKTTLTLAPAVAGDSADVTAVLRLPNTAASYATAGSNALLHQHARDAAANAGFAVDSYDRIGVVFPYIGPTEGIGGIPGSLITYGGLANVIGKNFWVNGFYDFRIVGHEIGHTYGLRHGNLWQVTDGNPVSLTHGSSTEYGDPFDLMGGGNEFENDFSHWNKSLLQWIPDSAVTVVQSPGVYRVHRFDAAGANLAQPRALKLVRDAVRDYWIGYRRGTANASLDGGAYVLWGYNTNQPGNLLDLTTPGTNPQDAALAVGVSFTDTAAGITLTPLAQGGSGADEYLDVEIALLPRIAWVSAAYLASESGGSVTLTARRTMNAAGAVSVGFATANGTATSPADYTAQAGTLSWADGDTADKTVTIALVADGVVEGVETFTVTLSGITGGVLGDQAVATVSIADPGVRDATFAANFLNSTVERVLPLPDGGVLVAGWFSEGQDSSFDLHPRGGLARLGGGGAIDPDFGSGGGANVTPVRVLARQPDGRILVAGNFTTFHGAAHNRLVRLNGDGTLDPSFNIGTGPGAQIRALVIQPDGKIIVGGDFNSFNGTPRETVARLNADGSLDTTWVGPDFPGGNPWGWVKSLALQPDGKLLVGGIFYTNNAPPWRNGLCRLNADGSLDASFNGISDGFLADTFVDGPNLIRVQSDGSILVAGGFTHYNGVARTGIARLTATGQLDATFDPQPNGTVHAVVDLPGGGILIGGDFTSVNGTGATRIALLSASGAVDTAFAAAGGHASSVRDLALTSEGTVMLAGNFASFQGASPSRPVWRFFSGLNGTPGSVQFASANYAGTEGASVVLTVTRTGSGLGALGVGYSTVAGTAGAADFTPASGLLTWADGDLAPKTITIPLSADELAEGVESFTVNLGAPLLGGALLGTVQQAVVEISDPVPPGYTLFRTAHFTTGELLDPAVSGPDADPDGDGLVNLLEYALGRDPRAADTAGLPAVTTVGGEWVFTYTRPASRHDLAYLVEKSTGLATWTTTGVTHEFVSASGGIETWRARHTVTGTPVLFFRLRATLDP